MQARHTKLYFGFSSPPGQGKAEKFRLSCFFYKEERTTGLSSFADMKKILSCAHSGRIGRPGFFSPLYRVKKRACMVTVFGSNTENVAKIHCQVL